MVTFTVSCKKCEWHMDYGTDGTLEDIKKHWKEYNESNAKNMDCVHEYKFKERETFLK